MLRTFCQPEQVGQAIKELVEEAERKDLCIHGVWVTSVPTDDSDFQVVLFGD